MAVLPTQFPVFWANNSYQFHKIVLQLINVVVMIYYRSKGAQMSGVVKINITETEEEIKALLGKAKDAYSHEKLLALYWLKTKTA